MVLWLLVHGVIQKSNFALISLYKFLLCMLETTIVMKFRFRAWLEYRNLFNT